MKKVLYIHGRGGSSNGTKIQNLRSLNKYEVYAFDYKTPVGDNIDDKDDALFAQFVADAKGHISEVQPDVIVASSYGGAVLLQIILDGNWDKGSVFLAQAGVKFHIGDHIPSHVPAVLIHGIQDDVVAYQGSVMLAKSSDNARLISVNDGHRLYQPESTAAIIEAIDSL